MVSRWTASEECLTLPGENLGERLVKANSLIKLLRDRKSSAPVTDSRKKWTDWIKKNLYEIMGSEEYLISPKDCASTQGEYLRLDITVEESKFPKRIVLAVESELDDSKGRRTAIEHDFEKLLAIKSSFKLMVFTTQRQDFTNEKALEMFEGSVNGYGHHLLGETYIFVDYNEDSGDNGNFIAHTWQPYKSGVQVKRVHFALAE